LQLQEASSSGEVSSELTEIEADNSLFDAEFGSVFAGVILQVLDLKLDQL
jgi:hypothetical protein